MNRSFLAPTLLGVTLTLAGCGNVGSASSSTSVAEVDACALLTLPESRKRPASLPAPARTWDPTAECLCNWPAADGSHPVVVSVLVAPSDNYESFGAAMAKWQESAEEMDFPFDPGDYEEVEGAGDVSAWLRELGMLQAHQGHRMIQVSAEVAPGRDRLPASIALARQALARLE